MTPASVVTQIKTQLNNEINIVKGLTGKAIIPINSNSNDNEKIRTRRNNQRARQKTYRHNHRRLQVWVASNLTAITATYEAKIVVIIAARLPKVQMAQRQGKNHHKIITPWLLAYLLPDYY